MEVMGYRWPPSSPPAADRGGEGDGPFLRLVVVLGALSTFSPLSIAIPAGAARLAADLGAGVVGAQLRPTGCFLGLGQVVAGLAQRRVRALAAARA